MTSGGKKIDEGRAKLRRVHTIPAESLAVYGRCDPLGEELKAQERVLRLNVVGRHRIIKKKKEKRRLAEKYSLLDSLRPTIG